MKNHYTNHKLCKQCKGKCCKIMPGTTLPEDFGTPLLDNLKKAFASGKWSIDWWEGDPTGKGGNNGYYIRPKTKNTNKLYDASWGGECIFLKESGCELSFNDRPAACKALEPLKNNKCTAHIDKQKCAIAWMSYHSEIHKAAEKYK